MLGRRTARWWAPAAAGLLAVAATAGCGGRGPDAPDGPPPPEASDPGCAPARPAEPPEGLQALRHGGRDRRYLLTLPDGYDGASAVPLVVNLHGFGSDAPAFEATTAMGAAGADRGVAVVTPQALGHRPRWNWDRRPDGPDDYGFVHALVADLSDRLCVDPGRIFASGSSNGAAFAGMLVCDPPHVFSAVAMVIATTPSTCPPGVAPSSLSIRGTADRTPAADGMVAADAERYACRLPPAEERVADGVTRRTYGGCGGSAELALVTIEGGEHLWPGSPQADRPSNAPAARTFPATDTILDFFDRSGVRE